MSVLDIQAISKRFISSWSCGPVCVNYCTEYAYPQLVISGFQTPQRKKATSCVTILIKFLYFMSLVLNIAHFSQCDILFVRHAKFGSIFRHIYLSQRVLLLLLDW